VVAQDLKIKAPTEKYLLGCGAFWNISPNIELEESGIKEDKEQLEEEMYTEPFRDNHELM